MRLIAGVALAALALFPAQAQQALSADSYPSRPLRIIVPFAPGGASDVVARVLAPELSRVLGQPVTVVNRAGGSGNLGVEDAAQAPADGYTVLLTNSATITINPTLFENLAVQPLKDLTPVSILADSPGVLIAGRDFPPDTLAELIAYVKERPGSVTYASPGSGSVNRMEMELLKSAAHLEMPHRPYKSGAAPAVKDVTEGRVDLMFAPVSSALAGLKDGSLKAYAVTTPSRVAAAPNVPTMLELGFKDEISGSWQGVFVPVRTPKPVVQRLYAAVIEAMKDEGLRRTLAEAGIFPGPSGSSAEFRRFIEDETDKWARLITTMGLRPD